MTFKAPAPTEVCPLVSPCKIDEHEASLGVAKTLGIFDVGVLAAYNFDRDGT
jgi:hypothetical protein